MTDEEIKAMQEENAALKAAAAEKEAIAEKLTATEQALAKLQNKEFNFKKFRDMTQEEKDKLTDMELALKEKQDKLEEEQKAFVKSTVDSIKSDALDKLSAGDADLRKRMEAEFDAFKGDVTDKKAIIERALKAATIAKGAPEVSAVGAALGLTGEPPKKPEPRNFAETEEGRGLANALGLAQAKETKQ